jgi:hypothetical protein
MKKPRPFVLAKRPRRRKRRGTRARREPEHPVAERLLLQLLEALTSDTMLARLVTRRWDENRERAR